MGTQSQLTSGNRMFHIKTDIRQFKCESADKVERLIRNWVIRPSDLIYNAREEAWNPIGQHPAFDDIFGGIEQEEANEPDTIVTDARSEVRAEPQAEPPIGPQVEPAAELEASDDEVTDVREDPRRETDQQDAAEPAGGGRHGLPEEVFVTDELPRRDVQQAVIDELGALEEEVDDGKDDEEITELLERDDEETDQRKSRWRIVMSEEVDEEEPNEPQPSVEAGAGADAQAVQGEQAAEDDPAGGELDELLDEAAELVGLGEPSEPLDIEAAAIEPVEDEDEDDDARHRAETPLHRPALQPDVFVSEGYKLPLPVDISPSPEDIRLGLAHSRVGKQVKDATFPYPEPKKRGDVARREFDLDPEETADHSMAIVVAFVITTLIAIVAAVVVFG